MPRFAATALCIFTIAFTSARAAAQPAAGDAGLGPLPPGRIAAPESPAAQVDVAPKVNDGQIAQRLVRILRATPDWYYEPHVEVQEGVAFLRGQTATEERKKWAGDLARSTEGVVAVVNLMDVMQSPIWDFSPALAGIYDLWHTSVRRSPWVVFCLAIVVIAYFASRLTRVLLLWVFRRRFGSQLLRGVAAWVGGALVFLFGLYVVLYVSGLTRLALTVLGGTGLVGLVLGIGFRDITENFLASIFLSVQIPFRNGDQVDINGVRGIVERMTVRSTLLMTFEGNQVQIPNAVIYKSTITNFTTNPNRREDFAVGVGYESDIEKAQALVHELLKEHPAVLHDPEPMVLAEAFAPSSITLRVYFWVDVQQHSGVRVRSSLIRQVKQAFHAAGITIPYETRELKFPAGVPLLTSRKEDGRAAPLPSPKQPAPPPAAVATSAEGQLVSEVEDIKHQAEQARGPDPGADLLPADDPEPTTST